MQELLKSKLEVVHIYATEELAFLNCDFTPVSDRELKRISGLKTPNRVLAVVCIPSDMNIDWSSDLVLFLDGIQDPGNLGTIIRTALWFNVSNIICSTDCVDAYDRKVVQSTMGGLFQVNLIYQDWTMVSELVKKNDHTVIGAAMEGKSIYKTDIPEKTLLIIGSESHGMRQGTKDSCDVICSIPNLEIEQKIESLNAGIATGIVLSELRRKQQGG